MEIPLVYPKIPSKTNLVFKNVIAFEKYDGSNLHFCWYPDYSWSYLGTRRDRYCFGSGMAEFEKDHPEILNADQLLDPDEKLDQYFRSKPKFNSCKEIIVFAEYFGPNSFAGHHWYYDPKQLVIFDVMLDGKLMPPEEFVEEFSEFNIAKVIYRGKYNGQFAEDVRKGKYKVNEGVVVKGVIDGEVKMLKIKTNAYVEKLKKQFGDKWKNY